MTLNGCLGEDYLVEVGSSDYHKEVDHQTVYLCNHCTIMKDKKVNEGEEDEKTIEVEVPNEILVSRLTVYDQLIPLLHSVLAHSTTEKVWICPDCHRINKIQETKQIVPTKENPFYVKKIWDMPKIGIGISNRFGFHEEFSHWFYSFLEEINWQEVLYRIEWKSQNDGEEMDSSYKDKGDS